MQVMEASRGVFFKRYAIMFVLTPDTPETLLGDLRQVKAALLEWASKRGKKAERVMFTVMTDSKHFDACESAFRSLTNEEVDLAPILGRLQVELEFPDRRGKKTERSVNLNAP